MKRIALIAILAFSGCTTESIHMRHPTTGQTAICGAHPMAFPIYATMAAAHDKDCVQDYKEQGYVRVPGGS